MRWILTVSALSLLLLGIALWRQEAPELAIRNESGLAIRSVDVAIGEKNTQVAEFAGSTAQWQVLPPSVRSRREGPILVTLHLEDGRDRRLRAGWFSPSMTGDATLIVVSADSVRFEQR